MQCSQVCVIRDIMSAKSERTVADVCVTGSPLTQSLTCSSGSSQAGWLKPLSAPGPPLDHTAHAGPHQLLQSPLPWQLKCIRYLLSLTRSCDPPLSQLIPTKLISPAAQELPVSNSILKKTKTHTRFHTFIWAACMFPVNNSVAFVQTITKTNTDTHNKDTCT